MTTLLECLTASQTILKNVSGIVAAYRLLPENAPTDVRLPAAVQLPLRGDLSYTPSLRQLVHRWRLDVLVDRAGDMQGDLAAAVAFVEPIVAAYEANTTLGLAGVFDARPEAYEVVQVQHWQQSFLAVRFTVACKVKTGVTVS
jgi:hypothetical protein